MEEGALTGGRQMLNPYSNIEARESRKVQETQIHFNTCRVLCSNSS